MFSTKMTKGAFAIRKKYKQNIGKGGEDFEFEKSPLLYFFHVRKTHFGSLPHLFIPLTPKKNKKKR